jgi:hypothetical protein
MPSQMPPKKPRQCRDDRSAGGLIRTTISWPRNAQPFLMIATLQNNGKVEGGDPARSQLQNPARSQPSSLVRSNLLSHVRSQLQSLARIHLPRPSQNPSAKAGQKPSAKRPSQKPFVICPVKSNCPSMLVRSHLLSLVRSQVHSLARGHLLSLAWYLPPRKARCQEACYSQDPSAMPHKKPSA